MGFLKGREEAERPAANSLWLLPSGPDQVGEYYVRPTPVRHMGDLMAGRKRNGIATLVAKSTGHRGSARLKSGPHACFRDSCPISLNRQAIVAVAVLGRVAFALDRTSGGDVLCTRTLSVGRKRAHQRSGESRVGKECGSKGKVRW